MDNNPISLNASGSELFLFLRHKRECGARVEHHPLGFFRLQLTSIDRLAEGLYLHVWPVGSLSKQEPLCPIHSHIFDLESRILLGRLANREYDVRYTNAGDCSVQEVAYEGHHSTRLATSQHATCQLTQHTEYGPGDIYQLPKGIFHETVILQEPTATLMQKRNVERGKRPLNLLPSRLACVSSRFDHQLISQESAWDCILSLFEESRDSSLGTP